MQNIQQKIIISGIQPSGEIHLGNYIGSIKNWINFQNNPKYKTMFFIADLHSLTNKTDPKQLKKSVLETLAIYIASGINYKESIIFLQSNIKEHANLGWILSCITPKNRLNKMTQFKSKSLNKENKINLGLFIYPVLMAADILLYKANIVPVGEDQIQHIEFTRDLVLLFNNCFNSQYFPMPEFFTNSEFARIMNLKDANQKMSKSSSSELGKISMLDSKENIYKKIKKAKTDNLSYISYDKEKRLEVSNLINIFSSISGISKDKIVQNYTNAGMGKFKENLAELLIEHLSIIQKNYKELMNNLDYLKSLMSYGNRKAQEIATQNYNDIKSLIGLI